jgi:hypothetical protein
MTSQTVAQSTLSRNFLYEPSDSRNPLGRAAYHLRRHAQAQAVPAPVSPTIQNQQRIIAASGIDSGNPRDSHALLLDQWLAKQTAWNGFVQELHAGA